MRSSATSCKRWTIGFLAAAAVGGPLVFWVNWVIIHDEDPRLMPLTCGLIFALVGIALGGAALSFGQYRQERRWRG